MAVSDASDGEYWGDAGEYAVCPRRVMPLLPPPPPEAAEPYCMDDGLYWGDAGLYWGDEGLY